VFLARIATGFLAFSRLVDVLFKGNAE